MRNLHSFKSQDTFELYTETLSGKSEDVRRILAEIDGQIRQQFEAFSKEGATNSLEHIIAMNVADEQKDRLIKLYRYKSKVMQKIKDEVLSAGRPRSVSECQYCTINSVNAMDHIMPKGAFPEFSVNAHNLFPCCAECNSYKSETWLKDGKRQFLNLYLDPLPDTQYLFATIRHESDVIQVSFQLRNTGGIDASMFELIDAHYTNLHLLDRFSKSSNMVVTNLKNTLTSLPKPLTADEARQFGRDIAAKNAQYFGGNHWKTVLELALTEDDDFLLLCGLR